MDHRIVRWLMLVLFVALQAMTPFIHAHAAPLAASAAGGEPAGSWARSGPAADGFLHIHPRAHLDPACQSGAVPDAGAEVDVPSGVATRTDARTARRPMHVAMRPPVAPADAAHGRRNEMHAADVPPGRASPYFRLPPAFAPPAA